MPPPTAPTSCVIHAPAKLNLCLELLGKRADGFHELRTVMATIGLRDTLRVSADNGSGALALTVCSARGAAGAPADETNLVVRALKRLREASGTPLGARAWLHKRVPSQAGLGGGSSDAAAALVAANRVWGLGWPLERLAEIAAGLGSDIPFFVHALGDRRRRGAIAHGRGERVTPIAIRGRLPIVIVKPDEGLGTAAVYAACQNDDYSVAGRNRSDEIVQALAAGDQWRLADAMRNGLQAAATRLAPWLERLGEAMSALGCANHQLSGSGSAYFGLTSTMGQARRVAARLRTLRLGRVYATTVG